jgi:hypothetical protein
MRNNPFSTSAVLVNRARLIEAGGFDPTLPSAEDYDLWLRLAMLPGMRFGFVEQALGRYRVRAGSESSATDRRLQALLMIGERYADPVARASPLGGLEPWIFRAKTYMTTGIRLLRQRRIVRGLRLLLLGVAMWPFRLDLIRIAIAQRTARRTARRTAHGTA